MKARREDCHLIEVSIRPNVITVKGHANYAPHGQDIVCSGISTLVQTAVKAIEDLTEDSIEYSMEPGMVIIEYGDLSEKSKLLIDSFFIGVCMIADGYPNYVKITSCRH